MGDEDERFYGNYATIMVWQYDNNKWKLIDHVNPLLMLNCHEDSEILEGKPYFEFTIWSTVSAISSWFIFSENDTLLFGGCVSETTPKFSLRDGNYLVRPLSIQDQLSICGLEISAIYEVSFQYANGECIFSGAKFDPSSSLSIIFQGSTTSFHVNVNVNHAESYLQHLFSPMFEDFDLLVTSIMPRLEFLLTVPFSPAVDQDLIFMKILSDLENYLRSSLHDIDFRIVSILPNHHRRSLQTYFAGRTISFLFQ